MPKPILLAVADLHLSGKAPGSRVDDWQEAQRRLMVKITKTAKELSVPVIVSGDIFDRAKEDPWIVSFAIRHMKQARWFGIPGQHDLPGHALTRLEESSFFTLMESGVLTNVEGVMDFPEFRLYGQPYGASPVNADDVFSGTKDKMRILMGHQCVYEVPLYPNAPETGLVKSVIKNYRGFDILIFGDNHKGFVNTFKVGKGSTTVIVPGTSMRRHRDDIDYKPRAWVIYDDKTVTPVVLPRKNDEFHEASLVEKNEKLTAFVESLENNTEITLSFVHNLKCYLEGAAEVSNAVREIIWASVEGK
jgi:DNA repair exonuclease SbcCD nuclease subunit